MKKTLLVLLAGTLALTASAQSWQDALLYAENEYVGTARSVAMGNALTAVGGDLGSIGLNPAGSAVAGYSQYTITPALSISVANAASTNPELGFGDRVSTAYTRMKMPNIGVVASMETGRRSGLKRISFGFISNATNDFTGRVYATGVNTHNSYCGSIASLAAGYPQEALSGTASKYGWYNLDDYAETWNLDWASMVAYRSGIISTVNGRYLGITDWDKDGKNSGILADLYQKYGVQSKGYKHDMLFNFGLNYSDTFYFGANLGIILLKYGQAEYWQEAPNKESEFPAIPFDENPNARFQQLEMKRIFDAKGAGAYLKFGALWRPVGGLRLGVAFQTPTIMDVETRMGYSGKAEVSGVNLRPAQSPEWDDAFAFVSPMRLNAGIAYTLGKVALISADYELVNYAWSKFRSQTESNYYYPSNYFNDVNADINDLLGVSHMLRTGMEVNVGGGVAVRAGYTLTTSGIHNYLEWVKDEDTGKENLMVIPLTSEERASLIKHSFAFGVGYTYGHCFTDFTVRYRSTPCSSFTPYEYYDYDTDYTDKYSVNGLEDKAYQNYQVPQVEASFRRLDVMLTLGMRF